MEVTRGRDRHADHGPQEGRIGVKQFAGKSPVREQGLRAVKIFKNALSKAARWMMPFFDVAPFLCRNQKGKHIDLPGPIGALRIAVDVVGDSVLADAALRACPSAGQFGGTDLFKRVQKLRPMWTVLSALIERLIVGLPMLLRRMVELNSHQALPLAVSEH